MIRNFIVESLLWLRFLSHQKVRQFKKSRMSQMIAFLFFKGIFEERLQSSCYWELRWWVQTWLLPQAQATSIGFSESVPRCRYRTGHMTSTPSGSHLFQEFTNGQFDLEVLECRNYPWQRRWVMLNHSLNHSSTYLLFFHLNCSKPC